MSVSSSSLATPEGPGSVSGAPFLPAGFTDTFTSRYIDTGGLRAWLDMRGLIYLQLPYPTRPEPPDRRN